MQENMPIQMCFEEKPVRIIMRDGEPWWVAKDVCDILNIKNSRSAVTRLDADEKGVGKTDTLKGAQDVAVVSEYGLYKLILRSNKIEARTFLRWITHEVLPSIFRTGTYSVTQPNTVAISSGKILDQMKEIALRQAEFERKISEHLSETSRFIMSREIRSLRGHYIDIMVHAELKEAIRRVQEITGEHPAVILDKAVDDYYDKVLTDTQLI